MATTVERHEPDIPVSDRGLERLGKSLDRDIASATTDPDELGGALSTALILLGARCVSDPTANKLETWESVVAAMQVSSALFATANAEPGAEVECRIAGEVRTLPGTGPNRHTDAGNWLTAFWLAVVCRDTARLDLLAATPLDLLRASGAQYEAFVYDWVDALRTYWSEGDGLADKIQAAIVGSDPEVATSVSRDLLLKILYPPLPVFYRFVGDEHDEFNAALLQAVELHKDFFTSGDEDRFRDPTGFVALAPLALACLAHDAEFPVEVESGYLPEHLVKRSWLGEFPT
ncbi:immunity 49 family protein [Umezawaea endophytica]|uniref:Immunity 49 family protein n=1 Tax=Umezawaea endophytica TaxID=1654476 RepID=A0A9X3A1L7_9PSEU|nr:immunity 49 family protein [Umezawaea endophytica]MCS7478108.1 immunity 49 family protein [Umezawaea endophytica]